MSAADPQWLERAAIDMSASEFPGEWDESSDEWRESVRSCIRAALPAIEAGLREQIAREVAAKLGVTSRALPIIRGAR